MVLIISFWKIFLLNMENKLSGFWKISCTHHFRTSVVSDLCYDMLQAVSSSLFLYAGDSFSLYQHKDVQIEKWFNEGFENLCDCLVDNKLSIHFGKDKTQSFPFASKWGGYNIRQLNMKYNDINIKQHLKVTSWIHAIWDDVRKANDIKSY